MRSQAAISPDGRPHRLPDMLNGAQAAAMVAWGSAAEKALAKHRLNHSRADLVELGARTKERGFAKAKSRRAPTLYAKDICPWYFDPPVAASTDTLMVCYAGRCNPLAEGKACCKAKGGVFKCPRSRPFMCSKKDCDGDRCCVEAAEQCSSHGGRRRCEGPPGPSGAAGAAGRSGSAGAKGDRGEAGDPGQAGGLPPSSLASRGASFFAVMGANMVMAFLMLQCFNSRHGKASGGDAGHDELQADYDDQDYAPPAEELQAEPR